MDIHSQLRILKAKNLKYPYVVATGRECVTSRGSILIFQTLAAAIVCRDELNKHENGFLKSRWEVKRLNLKDMSYPCVFFEELVDGGHLPVNRNFNRYTNLIWSSG